MVSFIFDKRLLTTNTYDIKSNTNGHLQSVKMRMDIARVMEMR